MPWRAARRAAAGELQRYTVHVPADLDGNSFFLSYNAENGTQVVSQLLFSSTPALTTGAARQRREQEKGGKAAGRRPALEMLVRNPATCARG